VSGGLAVCAEELMRVRAHESFRSELVEEIDGFLRRYEEQQRREQQRRDEELMRAFGARRGAVLRARLSPAEQRVLVELLALLDD
jgi:hypothetical protein